MGDLRRIVVCVLLSACGGDDGQNMPPIVVGDCGGLAAPGTWENITPPDIVVPPGEELHSRSRWTP